MRIVTRLFFMIPFLIYCNLSDAATIQELQDEITSLKKINAVQQAEIAQIKKSYQSSVLPLDGQFSGGDLKVVKVGNIVTFTLISPDYVGSRSAISTENLIPEWARPTHNSRVIAGQFNEYLIRLDIYTSGRIDMRYIPKNLNTSIAKLATPNFSFSGSYVL